MRVQEIVLTIIIFFLSFSILLGQDDEYVTDYQPIRYEDYVYKPSIKTALLHIDGLLTSQPILQLNQPIQMRLSFDDIAEEVVDYYYTIIQCNFDWTPNTNMQEMEYIEGFSGERIRDYEFSYNTMVDYVHYELRLPNEDFSWTKSGNYLLVVYENEDISNVVFTKRFMVTEQNMQISHKISQPLSFGKTRTSQEIDFTVNYEGIRVNNPQVEIKVALLQNGRWDNAITDLKPLFVRSEELVYDFQNEVMFNAGKEFRHLNLQTLRYRTDKMERIIEDKIDGNIVKLFLESPRAGVPYIFENDLNGKYLVNNEHEDEPETEADYVSTYFFLRKPVEIYGGDVYVWGGLTDFQILPEYKMTYRPEENAYVAKLFLKQGFYNYQYAFVKNEGPKKVDLEEIEGSWFETENDYFILVYYRPFGTRYDQLVAIKQFNSLR